MGQGNWLLMGGRGGNKNLVGRGVYLEGNFCRWGGEGEGMSKFLTVGHPPIPPCRENPEPGSQA